MWIQALNKASQSQGDKLSLLNSAPSDLLTKLQNKPLTHCKHHCHLSQFGCVLEDNKKMILYNDKCLYTFRYNVKSTNNRKANCSLVFLSKFKLHKTCEVKVENVHMEKMVNRDKDIVNNLRFFVI